jgi:hypothetical protein
MTKMNAFSPDSVLALNPHIAQYSSVGRVPRAFLTSTIASRAASGAPGKMSAGCPGTRCTATSQRSPWWIRKLETVRCVNVFSHQLLLSQLKPANRRDL